MKTEALKLRAQDGEDLKVFSAVLQDAIIPICDVAFLPAEREFVMVANRFRWESCSGELGVRPAAGPGPDQVAMAFERTHAALRVKGVDHVAYRDLDLKDRSQLLYLLCVERVEGALVLRFAPTGCIRLDTAAVDCTLEDIGEPWPTAYRPCHDDTVRDLAAQ